jgi:hypothetical protein
MESCCENLENRTESEPVEGKPDLTVQRCVVCNRRHFELTVDPGRLGMWGGTL